MTDPTPFASGDPIDPIDPSTAPLTTTTTPPADTHSEPPTAAAIKAKTAKEQALEAIYAAAGLAEVAATTLKARLNREQVGATTAQAKTRLAELQRQLETYRAEAGQTYAGLATRGKRTVDQTLVTAKHLSGMNERKGARAADGAGVPARSADEIIVVKDGDTVEEVIVVDKNDSAQPPPVS